MMAKYDTPEKVMMHVQQTGMKKGTLWRRGKTVRYLHGLQTLRGDDLFVVYATMRSWKKARKGGSLSVTAKNVTTEDTFDWFANATQVKYNEELDVFEDMGDE